MQGLTGYLSVRLVTGSPRSRHHHHQQHHHNHHRHPKVNAFSREREPKNSPSASGRQCHRPRMAPLSDRLRDSKTHTADPADLCSAPEGPDIATAVEARPCRCLSCCWWWWWWSSSKNRSLSISTSPPSTTPISTYRHPPHLWLWEHRRGARGRRSKEIGVGRRRRVGSQRRWTERELTEGCLEKGWDCSSALRRAVDQELQEREKMRNFLASLFNTVQTRR